MRTASRPVLIGGGVVLTAVVAFLAFGVFGVQTLFVDDEVDEANPFTVPAEAATTSSEPAGPDVGAGSAGAEPTPAQEPPTQVGTPEVVTVTSGQFVGNSRYTTVGVGFTITDGNQAFLRFEQFETNNGPDLDVYLRNSDDPDDFIDLGDLKGNIGDQNYELPTGLDLDRYDFVDIWCVRFGVSFGNAQLT